MNLLEATLLSVLLLVSTSASANRQTDARPTASREGPQGIRITRNGAQPSTSGSTDHFTGNVRIDQVFVPDDPARVHGASVTFEPGARTAWHAHPLGQTLIVTAGCGLVQSQGGPVQKILPGDVVWIPPNVKHWHGATESTAMTHIAIVERFEDKSTVWMEKVTDEQYLGK